MRLRNTFWALLALAVSALAACGNSPTEPQLASAYQLHSVNGLSVPAALDSSISERGHFYYRVVGRSIEILSQDSAWYSRATDAVERLPDGTLKLWGSECTRVPVAYRRSGDQLILVAEPNVPPPSMGSVPSHTRVNDTIQVKGSGLLHVVRQAPTIHDREGRVLRFEYREGRPTVPVCG